MPERQFITIDGATFDGVTLNEVALDDPNYRRLTGSVNGATYNEEHLREWANDRWGTPLDASLDIIARDIKQGGWMLLELIVPAETDLEFQTRPRLGLSTLVRREENK